MSEAFKLAVVRREIVIFCESFPDIVKTHGPDAMGSICLALGKCFLAIGGTLDDYTVAQNIPGIPALPRVAEIGERLRVLGLQIIHDPKEGDLVHTCEVLRRQVELLTELCAKSGGLQ